MSVSNGQLANATTFNTAFMSRTANDNTTGIKSLQNAVAASGPDVINVQREVNSLNSFTGRASGSAYNVTPSWTNNDVGTSGDDLFDRADALTAEFNATSGHNHDGTTGSGGEISAADLGDLNYFRADWQTFSKTSVSGSSVDISSEMGGKTPGGTSTVAGVITTAPNNRVTLVSLASEQAIEDAQGQRVYGRITEATGVWTLSFYTLESGVETAHSLSSQDIRAYFREVFTLETLPTIGADVGQIPSLDMTADIVDAGPNQRGLTRFAADGAVGLSNGDVSVSVTFSTAFPNTSYSIAFALRNTVDASPIMLQGIVTAKSVSGFTVKLNAPTDSANYLFEYTATRNA